MKEKLLTLRKEANMREQLEILLYQFKKQNNLDIHSELNIDDLWTFILAVQQEIQRVNKIHEARNDIRRISK